MKRPPSWVPIFPFGLFLLMAAGCQDEKDVNPRWEFQKKIRIPDVKPLGIAGSEDAFWIADAGNNRVVKVDGTGRVLSSYDSIQRPMHLTTHNGALYIPEYLRDRILVLGERGDRSVQPVETPLDAPAGIGFQGDRWAIADFYGNRIVMGGANGEKIVGRKGKEEGALHYPTDLELHRDSLWVADAYNHRVQVFGMDGDLLQVIGQKDSLKVASGIDVTATELAVTDQEHDRVLIYAHDGELLQRLKEGVRYPTDVHLRKDTLYIANFKGHSLTVYAR